jgi:SAM-dependent methyltransferase
MIAEARQRLGRYPNVVLHIGSGSDLAFLPDEQFDLAFSYIVFQHIPSRGIIENYVRETARVLKPGGVFKFQLNGARILEQADRERDTWQGEVYSLAEACRMVREAGLAPIFADGIGTQYFLLAARKGWPDTTARVCCLFPAQPGAEPRLLEGWQGAGETSSRSVRPRFRTLLAAPRVGRLTFFLAICFPPLDPFPACTIAASVEGREIGRAEARRKGDYYFEWPAPAEISGSEAIVTVELDPPFGSADEPAVRSLGIFAPRT